MRRSSFTPVFSLSTQEPLIVVEETNTVEDGGGAEGAAGGVDTTGATRKSTSDDSEPDSPVNPYLLCPFPDMQQRRKHSLPSLQITEGITASQVRRLSEVGGENGGLSPKEVEFLATLSQKANPAAGGRRHSVVTISAVPPTLFGRNRRESLTGMPLGGGSRRGSIIQGPPLTDHRGSIHNLQLDIMDGIVQTRKRAGSGVWTAPVLQETENNVPVQT
ncbi:PREDICTED: uncharacterized protein LOC108977057 [Bactrocera latifrons]|uniref:uncharacterized protein LOC108977057 n=1 Tax=Bactrocera latifrons TaxID=174628 RepID=UPI0008DC78BD|nr:PREDICTED: uncharacterized protein LOC108977057 [Bactrocera latifrons]XP_018803269.1 PREDICTED: uncharacterized protein LOC108977057 [Bactrocera latifrons]XP_018803723.1 PREDICTED: uncharacterized protein LOC108977057 [Bactrocera latifrons]XP_018803799.1 PREDICTED: uncharacterized protein LOC108977057 [Bactrocera latifrons]XP_018803876.1 PREDICTED: uncharacterized protein LOC108977057 [Bactrocera latifrons]